MAKQGIAIVGPTASGKTRCAVEIAHLFGGEIISADSRQVYRGMDIGTGKDLDEYGDIPYHLIDICDAGSKYNLYQYLQDFNNIWEDLQRRNVRPIVCGGSGMYVENALRGIRMPEVPENPTLRNELASYTLEQLADILKGYTTLHNTVHIDTHARAIRAIEIEQYYAENPELANLRDARNTLPRPCIVLGVDVSREVRRTRISARLKSRLEEGMIDEIRELIQSGVKPEDLIYYGLEYKYVTLHVIGKLSYDGMYDQLETAIHQFAKRQMTWFRGMEKRGIHIAWLSYEQLTDSAYMKEYLSKMI